MSLLGQRQEMDVYAERGLLKNNNRQIQIVRQIQSQTAKVYKHRQTGKSQAETDSIVKETKQTAGK